VGYFNIYVNIMNYIYINIFERYEQNGIRVDLFVLNLNIDIQKLISRK